MMLNPMVARGAHPTPPRLADSIISSEMLEATIQPKVKKQPQTCILQTSLLAFRNTSRNSISSEREEVTLDEDALDAVKRNERTSSGIPLLFQICLAAEESSRTHASKTQRIV